MVQAPWRGHPFPCQGFRVSQESCQPCSDQAETCTGCLGRAQGNGRGLLPPRWASSLLYTSMAGAWGLSAHLPSPQPCPPGTGAIT